ncbi:MAG: hypothetical protein LBD16_05065 [Oscillospiraceae bacterium]|jgi:tetratricopeptide (TPR) repeat protein|nr:hypothetical protein [Oscillospiraceae bacterium]
MKRIAAMFLLLMLIAGNAYALRDGIDYTYTYTYDYWGDMRESPDAYRVKQVIDSRGLGLDKPMRQPQGLFVRGDNIYICDTGNNRILQIRSSAGKFALVRVIDSFTGDVPLTTFNAPQDVFVGENGDLFIADTNNHRVLKLNSSLEYQLEFVKPTDATFDQNISFLPTKVVADTTGRVFALGKNVNKGVIKYESDGSFAGFTGASEVTFSWYDYIWKLLSTQAQRSQQVSFVPTEYENIALDAEGFIYATTTTFSEDDLANFVATPLRRLNSLGGDILIRNGEYPPMGDLWWDSSGDYSGPSRLTDVTVLGNDIYIALDRTRGRLFGYDEQGRMLWAFGGAGNMEGYFAYPTALEHMGYDLLVMDSTECTITVFTPTEYGMLMYAAIEDYQKGDYESSAAYWRKVLLMNGNNDLAYIGIGRALLRQDDYAHAMEYFRVTRDSKNYSDAFKLYRKEWVEEHISAIFAILAVLIIVPFVIGKARKIRMEVRYDGGKSI